jgi:uncharacterized alkaline shock family protein YloU
MDSIVHIENDKFIGRTNFRSGLVNNVVALSVREVAGVAGIAKSFSGFTMKPFLKTDGVKITYDKDGVIIDVCVALQYGFSAADVSYRVQENVINAASSMLDRKIKAVNVKIAHIHVPHMSEGRA